jgi:hypothetical protein
VSVEMANDFPTAKFHLKSIQEKNETGVMMNLLFYEFGALEVRELKKNEKDSRTKSNLLILQEFRLGSPAN